jgi:hypothetical protein
LDKAQNILRPAAITAQVGIMITRLSPGRYEARLNPELPPGTTIEKWGAQVG